MKHKDFLFYDPYSGKIRKIYWLMCSTNNLPEKQLIKLNRKVRVILRTLHYRINGECTRCPICSDNRYVVLHKRVNQHKFKFHCMECKFSYMLTIEPHEILCDNCNGAGVKRVMVRPSIGKGYFNSTLCKVCNGNGRLDWVSRVTKAKGTC